MAASRSPPPSLPPSVPTQRPRVSGSGLHALVRNHATQKESRHVQVPQNIQEIGGGEGAEEIREGGREGRREGGKGGGGGREGGISKAPTLL